MSKTPITAVNTLRARLQKEFESYFYNISHNYDGEYDADEAEMRRMTDKNDLLGYIHACAELYIISIGESASLQASVQSGEIIGSKKLHRIHEMPIQLPNISYSDTMNFISHKLQSLLRERMAITISNDAFDSHSAMVEEEYFNTGVHLKIFTEAQINDLLRTKESFIRR